MVQVRARGRVSYQEPSAQSDDSSDDDVPVVKAPKPAPKPRRRKAAEQPDEFAEGSLMDVVQKHGSAISVAAKEWVDRYAANRAAATAELLTFLLQACGVVSRVVSAGEVEEGEVDSLKAEVDTLAEEEGLSPPTTGRAARNFRANFNELWDKCVREAHAAGLLFDQYLLDKVINLLIALNTSVVRDFRTTATLAASQLVTSIIYVMLTLTEARETAARQLAAEEKKKGGKAGSERVAALKRAVERAHGQVGELRSYTDSLFQGIFAHRFRDVSDEVRGLVIEGIGTWVRLMPGTFMNDSQLKYIAWGLSDKSPGVRCTAATALLALYGNRDNASTLRDFTERFCQRFAELLRDVDERVAITGVKLVTTLVRSGHMPAVAVKGVYRLLADDAPALRHAAAELVATMLAEQGAVALKAAADAAPGSAGRAGGGRRKSAPSAAAADFSPREQQLAGVLNLMKLLSEDAAKLRVRAVGGSPGDGDEDEGAEAAAPLGRDLVEQVVDAIFDRVEALHDWQLQVDWVRKDTAREYFGEAGATNLVATMRAALTKAVGGQLSAAAPVAEKKGAGAKERAAAQATARQEATLVFMKELSPMLRKAQNNARQARSLVAILQHLALEVWSLKRQERAFATLLGSVRDVMFRLADRELAEECAIAIVHATRKGPDSVRDAAAVVLSECVEEAASRLAAAVGALEAAPARTRKAAVDSFLAGGEEEEDQLLFDCRSALLRLRALLALDGAAAEAAGAAPAALGRLLEGWAAGRPLPAAVGAPALASALLTLTWQLRAASAGGAAPVAVGQQREALTAQVEAIAGRAEAGGNPSLDQQAVLAEALRVQSDLWVAFAAGKVEGEAAAAPPSDGEVESFWRRCEGFVTRGAEGAEADEAGAQAAASLRTQVMSQVAKLALFRAVPQGARLAAGLVSHWGGPHPEVASLAKETCRLMKKSDGEALPGVYLLAMQEAYERAKDVPPALPSGLADDEEEEEEEAAAEAWDAFLALSQRIAASHAGFNASGGVLAYVCSEGGRWAVAGGADRIDFLSGVAHFATRLPPTRADGVLRGLEVAAASAGASVEADEWSLLYDFIALLQDRKAKGNVKSAMRKSSKSPAPPAAERKPSRKISFAPPKSEAHGSDDDEGEEEEHGVHAVQYKEDDVIEGSDEEEEEEVVVLPTEEQVPTGGRGKKAAAPLAPAAAAGRRGGRRAPVTLFDVQEVEEARRVEEGGNDREAAIDFDDDDLVEVPGLPAAHAADSGDDSDKEEEERRARKRRARG